MACVRAALVKRIVFDTAAKMLVSFSSFRGGNGVVCTLAGISTCGFSAYRWLEAGSGAGRRLAEG